MGLAPLLLAVGCPRRIPPSPAAVAALSGTGREQVQRAACERCLGDHQLYQSLIHYGRAWSEIAAVALFACSLSHLIHFLHFLLLLPYLVPFHFLLPLLPLAGHRGCAALALPRAAAGTGRGPSAAVRMGFCYPGTEGQTQEQQAWGKGQQSWGPMDLQPDRAPGRVHQGRAAARSPHALRCAPPSSVPWLSSGCATNRSWARCHLRARGQLGTTAVWVYWGHQVAAPSSSLCPA